MAKNRVSSAMDGSSEDKPKKKKKGKKFRIKEMHIRRDSKGGYIAKHDLNEPAEDGTNSEEAGNIPDMQALHKHIDDNMEEEASPDQPSSKQDTI